MLASAPQTGATWAWPGSSVSSCHDVYTVDATQNIISHGVNAPTIYRSVAITKPSTCVRRKVALVPRLTCVLLVELCVVRGTIVSDYMGEHTYRVEIEVHAREQKAIIPIQLDVGVGVRTRSVFAKINNTMRITRIETTVGAQVV